MGSLNRTVGPVLWSQNLNNNGSVKTVTVTELLEAYTELPEGITNIDLSQCADSNSSTGAKVGDITVSALPIAEELFCIDGNSVSLPKFSFSSDMNISLQHNN